MIVLGVGGWTDESELLAISSFPQSSNYIKVRNYDDLRNFAERMADYLCNSKCIPTSEIITCATVSVFPHLRLLLLNIGYVSNETNTDVRMYIEEFILVDLDTLLHKVEVIWNGNYTGIYTII